MLIPVTVLHCSLAPLAVPETFARALEGLPPAERQRVLGRKVAPARQARLAARLLLREALRTLGYGDDVLQGLSYTAQGRPFVAGLPDFSLTHAGDLAACAVTSRGRVGVDLELLTPRDWRDFRDYVHPATWESITRSEDPLRRFLEVWTIQESVVKCEGSGLANDLSSLVLNSDRADLGGQVFHVQDLACPEGYVGAIATDAGPAMVTVRHVEARDLVG